MRGVRRFVFPAAISLVLVSGLGLAAFAQITEVPPADDPAPGQVLNVAVHPFSREDPTVVEEKVPLLEVFTATWCPPCKPAHGAVERLMAERSPGLGIHANESDPVKLALLSYHPFPDVGGEDPFGIPEGHNRLGEKHNVFWFPSGYVDGLLEDAPQTRSTAVDVGMEEILYSSYKGLIERVEENDPPFRLNVESTRLSNGGASWQVNVTLEATRAIDGPLFMQGVMWEDHVGFPGSSGVDRHRMVVRAMAPSMETPERLEAGETWQQSVTLNAPPAVNRDKAGVAIIIEAPWGEQRDERAGMFFSFAVLVAGGTAATAAWQTHTKNQARKRRREAAAETPATETDGPASAKDPQENPP